MSVRRILAVLVASGVMCGVADLAQAQSASPKDSSKDSSKVSTGATKPGSAKPEAAKPETKPAAAVAGSAEPALIGQFGTWGAYTATPNGK